MMSKSAMSRAVPRRGVWVTLLAMALGELLSVDAVAQIGSEFLVDLPGGNFSDQMYTGIQNAPGRPNDLFVSRADGVIYRLDLTTNTESPFVTLPDSDIDAGGGYWGMLGFTFAPDFATSGDLYVHVAGDRPEVAGPGPAEGVHHRIYVRRYSLGEPLSNNPTLGTPTDLLRWDQHGSDHSGGFLGFQPDDDNTLWISTGDGGNAEGANRDIMRTGQDPTDFKASILRIDVSQTGGGEFGNYAYPLNNPLLTGAPEYNNWAPEVWSIGLRSPWGGSFDRETGDFFIGDVGSSQLGGNTGQEEIDFERADSPGGRNYGWRIMEGTTCPESQDEGVSCDAGNPDPAFTPPVYDYEYGGGYGSAGADEFEGRSVTGGYVYRGPIEQLQGMYIFGDWSSHQIWGLEVDRDANGGLGGVVPGSLVNLSDVLGRETGPGQSFFNGTTAFGEDIAGNLYYLELGGSVYKICENCGPVEPLPMLLEPGPAIREDFDVDHNYQTGTVPAGGFWTAVRNEDNSGDDFDANITNAGQLTVGIEPGGWQDDGDTGGPMLYREVEAGSLLEVRVKISEQTAGNWSSAGIIVRVPGELGDDENFISAHSARPDGAPRATMSNVINGGEAESEEIVDSIDDLMFLRLVNNGEGEFEMFTSDTGEDDDWVSRLTATNSALTAAQEANSLVEVGLWAGSFGNDINGVAAFDWFEIILGVPAGDYNEDGIVNSADYIVWRNTMGDTVEPYAGADGDGDGMVTDNDYLVWKGNFGKEIPNFDNGNAAAVPEPASALLLLLSVMLLAASRRRG
jgi:hypothetical protein